MAPPSTPSPTSSSRNHLAAVTSPPATAAQPSLKPYHHHLHSRRAPQPTATPRQPPPRL
ncbi:hypothetical protein Tco_1152120, partial [Tanacetum coccineum]